MSSIDVLGARDRLIDTGICPERNAEPAVVFLDDLLDEALTPYATADSLERLIEQWRLERAEQMTIQAQFMADIRKEVSDFRAEDSERERQRDERERQRDERERERDERERQRDERERQRIRDQDDRDSKMRQWVIGAVSLGFAATTLVVGLLVAFG